MTVHGTNATVVAVLASFWIAGNLLTLTQGAWTLPGVAFAAESDQTPETTSDAEDIPDEATKPAAEAPEGTPATGKESPGEPDAAEDQSEEVFVPSEPISEDIDVPFPVDI
ncbi:MAG: hypothetical protein F4089_12040 [Gammaproteobacteria bacterium]|nr:hypothetical protein [Gammaproteobacteria bacterium]